MRPVVRPSGGMVDAGDSKSPDGNIVRVRVSPRAPKLPSNRRDVPVEACIFLNPVTKKAV